MTFPELSPEAQDAIVAVILGSPVPTLTQAQRDEIQAWAETDERPLPRVEIPAPPEPSETDYRPIQGVEATEAYQKLNPRV